VTENLRFLESVHEYYIINIIVYIYIMIVYIWFLVMLSERRFMDMYIDLNWWEGVQPCFYDTNTIDMGQQHLDLSINHLQPTFTSNLSTCDDERATDRILQPWQWEVV